MNARSRKGGRLPLLALGVVVAAMLFALPATAYAARSATKIVALKNVTVTRATPGVNPWLTKTLSVKLQKKVSGTYRPMSGTVTLSRWNPNANNGAGAFAKVASAKGSSVTFKLPGRGKYKLYYAGSTTTNPSTAYTSVWERIGLTIGAPEIVYSAVEGTTTQKWVNVKYNVNWNTEALGTAPVVLGYYGEFFNALTNASSPLWVYYERVATTPGVVEFNYKINNADQLDSLYTAANAYVEEQFRGNYVTTAELEHIE